MKRAASFLVVIGLLAAAPAAAAHGDEEPEPAAQGAMGEDAASEAAQPARTLAQQALAVLTVRDQVGEARHRLEAALKSKHREDVDIDKLRAALIALDAGDSRGAANRLNEALGGGPQPSDEELAGPSDEALHNAGEEFKPANDGQEVAAGIAGVLALMAGAYLLIRHGRAERDQPSA